MGFTRAPGAVAQQALDLLRLGHQSLVALAQRRDFRIDALEQALLGIAPADALLELAPHRCLFARTGECLVEQEPVGVERQSAVSGTSVSVRVVHGGRGTIKKKTKRVATHT